MKFLLFNCDNKDSGVDEEEIKILEREFEGAESIYKNLCKLSVFDYAYVYVRLKHDIENREEIGKAVNLIEGAIYYEPKQ